MVVAVARARVTEGVSDTKVDDIGVLLLVDETAGAAFATGKFRSGPVFAFEAVEELGVAACEQRAPGALGAIEEDGVGWFCRECEPL